MIDPRVEPRMEPRSEPEELEALSEAGAATAEGVERWPMTAAEAERVRKKRVMRFLVCIVTVVVEVLMLWKGLW